MKRAAFSEESLQSTIDVTKLSYMTVPRKEKLLSQSIPATTRLDMLLSCMKINAGNPHKCLVRLQKEAANDKNIVQEATSRLCNCHFTAFYEFFGLVSITMNTEQSQTCMARLLHNTTLSSEMIATMIHQAHFLKDHHPHLVESVVKVTVSHENSTLRQMAMLSLGSLTHRLQDRDPTKAKKLHQHLERLLFTSPLKTQTSADDIWHTSVVLRSLGNTADCKGLLSIIRHLNDSRSDVRQSALHALRHLNCSAAEDYLLKYLKSILTEDLDKAAAISSLRERSSRHKLSLETLAHLRQHALSDIGTDSDVEKALKAFYEDNDYVASEEHEFWKGLDPLKNQIAENRKRVKRAAESGIGNILKPLLNSRFGFERDWKWGFGEAGLMGAEASLTLRNFITLFASIFDGKLDIDLYNEALVRAWVLTTNKNIIHGGVFFQGALTYKNDIPSDLLDSVWKVANNAANSVKSLTSRVVIQLNNIIQYFDGLRQDLLELISNPLLDMVPPLLDFLTKVDKGLDFVLNIDNLFDLADRLSGQIPGLSIFVRAFDTMLNFVTALDSKLASLENLCQNVTGPFVTSLNSVTDDVSGVVQAIQNASFFISDQFFDRVDSAINSVEVIATHIISTSSVAGRIQRISEPILRTLNSSVTFTITVGARLATESPASHLAALETTLAKYESDLINFQQKGLVGVVAKDEYNMLKEKFSQAILFVNASLHSADVHVTRLTSSATQLTGLASTALSVGDQTLEEVDNGIKSALAVIGNFTQTTASQISTNVGKALDVVDKEIQRWEGIAQNVLAAANRALQIVQTKILSYIDDAAATLLQYFTRAAETLNIQGIVEKIRRTLLEQIDKVAEIIDDLIVTKFKSFVSNSIGRAQAFIDDKVDRAIQLALEKVADVQDWVLRRPKFAKMVNISQKLIVGAAQFSHIIQDFSPTTKDFNTFLQIAKDVVVESTRMDLISARLYSFYNQTTEITDPLQALVDEKMDLVEDEIQRRLQMARDVVNQAGDSLDVLQNASSLLGEFSEQAKSAVNDGFAFLSSKLNGLKGKVTELSVKIRDGLAVASDFTSFHSKSAVLLPHLNSLFDIKEQYQKYKTEVQEARTLADTTVVSFSRQYQVAKAAIQNIIEDHLQHLDEYASFACVPGSVCVTELLQNDLKDMITAVQDLRKLTASAQRFAAVSLPGVAEATATFTMKVQPLQLVVKQAEDFVKDIVLIENAAKELAIDKVQEVVETLRVTSSDVRTTVSTSVTAVLNPIAGQNGLLNRLRSFTQSVQSICTFIGDVRSYIPSSTALNSFRSALTFSEVVKTFLGDAVAEKFRTASNGLKQVQQAIRSLKQILGGDILGKIDSLTKRIVDIPQGLVDKLRDYLGTLQWQSRQLDPSDFDPWHTLSQCSEETCLRQLERSTKAYRDYVMPVKYIHFQTLCEKRFVIPGLYEDYQVQGITMLNRDGDDVLMSMFGTGLNEGKQPLIIAMDSKTGRFKKIFVIRTNTTLLKTTRFGIGETGQYVVLFGTYNNTAKTKSGVQNGVLHAIKKSQFTDTLDSDGPSDITVHKTYTTADAIGYGVFHDVDKKVLWLADYYNDVSNTTSSKSKSSTSKTSTTSTQTSTSTVVSDHSYAGESGWAAGFKLGSDGLPSSAIVKNNVMKASEAFIIGSEIQDMVLHNQLGRDYVVLLRCGKQIGFGCRLEFIQVPNRTSTVRSGISIRHLLSVDPARSVRVPDGAVGLAFTGWKNNKLVITFASASQANTASIALSLKDVEDSSYVISIPVTEQILDPKKAITRNEIFLRVLGKDVFPPRPLIAFPERNLTASKTSSNRRTTRNTDEDFNGCLNFGGNLVEGGPYELFSITMRFVAFVIPMEVKISASFNWRVDYQAGLCLADKSATGAIIPRAFVDVTGELAVNLFLVRFGLSLTATILDTRLVPEVRIRLVGLRLQTCVVTNIEVEALRLTVSAFAQFRVCIDFKCGGGWLSWVCWPVLEFCDKQEITLWSRGTGKSTAPLFNTCKAVTDTSPPTPGQVEAKQIGQDSIQMSWLDFKDEESTELRFEVGVFSGSRTIMPFTDMASGTSFTAAGLNMPHGQPVFVTVRALNDDDRATPATALPFIADTTPPAISVTDGNTTSGDIDYQFSETEIQAIFSVKDEADVVSTDWAIGTTPGTSDIRDFTDVGNSNELSNAELQLTHGQRYYVTIRAMNNLTMESEFTTNGVLIDTTHPVAGSVADGTYDPNDDQDFNVATINFRASWKDFSDPESPITHYEWTLIDDTGFPQFPFTNVGLNVSDYADNLRLVQGQRYFTVVRCWNKAGLFTDVTSDGFTVDSTLPVCGAVTDFLEGESEDVDYTAHLPQLEARWSCQDPESGIVRYEVAIGSYSGGQDLLGFADTPGSENSASAVFSGFTVLPGQRYFIIVRAWNQAGLRRTVISDGILLDITPPHVADTYLRDTLPLSLLTRDQDFQTTLEAAAPTWRFGFVDGESPVTTYTVSLEDESGRIVKTADFTSVTTTATFTELFLENGGIYTVIVNCTNAAGLTTSAKTDGFLVDITPPVMGSVFDGQNVLQDINYWHHTTSMFGNYPLCYLTNTSKPWPPKTTGTEQVSATRQCAQNTSYDLESGLFYAETAVRDRHGRMVIPWQYASIDFEWSGRNGSLEQGELYHFVVRIHNRAGLFAEKQTDGVILDNTPPEITGVFQSLKNTEKPLTVTREEALNISVHLSVSDPESGLVRTEWAVGSYRGGSDVMAWKNASGRSVDSATIGPLFDSQRYFITVTAENQARRTSSVITNGFVVDRTAPQQALVKDGWGLTNSEYQSVNQTLWGSWALTPDNVGFTNLEVGAGVTNAAASVGEYRPVSLTSSRARLSGLSLPTGVPVLFLLRSTDVGGFQVISASDGVIVDDTPPRCTGRVSDGLSGDVSWTFDVTLYSANWDACSDDESGVSLYSVGLSTQPDQLLADAAPFQTTGTVRQGIVYGLSLEEGVRYHTLMRAVNRAGLSTTVASNGFTIDASPPTCSFVRDGLIGDVNWQTASSRLAVNFNCFDAQSGLLSVEWAIGTYPGGTDVRDFSPIDRMSTSAEDASIVMEEGVQYYSSIQVSNNVGLTAVYTTNGMAYDSTAPDIAFVFDGLSRVEDDTYSSSTRQLSATWSSADTHSGIRSYEIAVGNAAGESNVIPFQSVGANLSATVDGSFIQGQTYYISIRATNNAGLTATSSSNGLTIDQTPAVCTHIGDGSSLLQDIDFQTSVSSLGVNWQCEDSESGLLSIQRSIPNSDRTEALPVASTSSVLGGFRLSNGNVYRTTLVVTNGAGVKKEFSTDGVVVDTAPPQFSFAAVIFNQTTNGLQGRWTAKDDGSGIDEYSWKIGTQPEGDDVLPLTSLGLMTSVSLQLGSSTGVSIQANQQYYVTIVATDKVGLTTQESVLVTTDTTPPEFDGSVTVQIIYPDQITDSGPIQVSLDASWFGFQDPETDIVSMAWTALSATNTADLNTLSYQQIPNEGSVVPTRARLTPFTVANGETYKFVLRATNGAGLHSYISVNFEASFGAFVAGTVRDGPRWEDEDYQTETTALWADWDGFRDPTHGIKRYEWAVGTEAGAFDVRGFEDVDLQTSAAHVHGLQLVSGQKYFATACAINQRDDRKCSSSNGITVDTSPPTVSNVQFNVGQDRKFIQSSENLWLSWQGTDEQSSIMTSFVALGNYPHGQSLMPFTEVGNVSRYQIKGISLSSKTSPIYATVRVSNKVGLVAEMVTDSIYIDSTPPSGGMVAMTRDRTLYKVLWEGFYDAESGIESFAVALGRAPGAADVWTWTNTGSTAGAELGPVGDVKHGELVYATVRAFDRAGLVTEAYSVGLFVDATAPVSSHVFDGQNPGEDAAYQTDGDYIAGSWLPFKEDVGEILEYQWAVGTSQGGSETLDFLSVGKSLSASSTSVLLQSGQTYFVTVRARNTEGLQTEASSNGILIDTSPPLAGQVIASEDSPSHSNFSSSKQLRAIISGFSDQQSGIAKYEWAVCTSAGDSCVQNFTNVRLVTNVSNPALHLIDGQCYVIKVRATNHAGLSTTVVSAPVTFDSTPPILGTVLDGRSTDDVDYQQAQSTLSANWRMFHDDQSGISTFDWCIGTEIGSCDIKHWESVEKQASASAGGLSLEQGKKYFTAVRATNRAGLSSIAYSDGIIIDITKPRCGAVRDGNAEFDISFQQFGDSFAASWDMCSDGESGIASYRWALGTMPGLSDIQPFTSSQLQTTFMKSVTTISDGTAVFATVVAVNGAGGETFIISDGVVVDSSPPTTPAVTLSHPSGRPFGRFENEQTTIDVKWQASDSESGIQKYKWEVCRMENNGEKCVEYGDNVKATDGHISVSELQPSVCYYVKVTAFNRAGLESEGHSQCTVLDWTAPEQGFVFDGLSGADVDFTSEANTLSTKWINFQDSESGLAKFEWCIGTSPLQHNNTMPCTSVGLETSATFKSDSLRDGIRYFVTVIAINNAGLRVSQVSNGVTIDSTPPVISTIRDGLGDTDVDFSSSAILVSANWLPFVDDVSGIERYEVAVGTHRGRNDVVDFTNVNTMTQAVIPCKLEQQAVVYVTVRAVNRAGLSSLSFSNGVLVDTTPPTAGLVWIKTRNSSGYQAQNDQLSAEWMGFEDGESGLVRYEWAICALDGGTCVQDFTDVHLKKNVSTEAVELQDGKSYIVKVRAFNGAGMFTESTSLSSLTVDTSPPAIGFVFDGQLFGIDENYQTNSSQLSASWTGFRDAQCPVVEYRVCASQETSPDTLVRCHAVNEKTSSTKLQLPLMPGVRYMVSVTATNAAGLMTSVLSNGMTVDTTAPRPGIVLDTLMQSVDDIDFQNSTTQLSARWSNFADDESGITEYAWSAGTTPGGTDVFALRNVGMALQATSSGHSVSPGTKVFITVRATNRAGLHVSASSDGVTIDNSPPVPGKVFDGPCKDASRDVDYQSNTATIEASWEDFVDPESGIEEYSFAVSEETLQPDGEQWSMPRIVQPYRSVDTNTTVRISGDLLAPGRRYKVLVRGTNGAGITAYSVSDGFIVDTAELELSVETWSGAQVYGSAWMSNPDNIGVSIDLSSNSSTNTSSTAGDPLTMYSLSIPIVGENVTSLNSSAQLELVTLGIALNETNLGSYEEASTPCCARGRLYQKLALADSHLLATGNVSSFASSISLSSSGFMAIGSAGSATLVHLDNPSDILFLRSLPVGDDVKTATSDQFGLFVSKSLAYLAEYGTTSKNIVDHVQIGLSSFSGATAFLLNAAISDRYAFLVTRQPSGSAVLHTIATQTASLSLLSSFTLTPSTPGHVAMSASGSFIAVSTGLDNVMLLSITTTSIEQRQVISTPSNVNSLILINGQDTLLVGVGMSSPSSGNGLVNVYSSNVLSRSSDLTCSIPGTEQSPLGTHLDAEQHNGEVMLVAGMDRSGLVQMVHVARDTAGRVSSCEKSTILTKSSAKDTSQLNSAALGSQVVAFSVKDVSGDKTVNTVYLSAFCRENFTRESSQKTSSMPLRCAPCGTGQKSSGGVMDNCRLCTSATKCLQSDQTRINNFVSAPNLTPAEAYVLQVKASTTSGKEAESSSIPFRLDPTPPISGIVFDSASGVDTTFVSSVDFGIGATWGGFEDDESGIREYKWCVGSSPQQCDVMEPTATFNSSAAVGCPECIVQSGQWYYTTVIATNWANLSTNASSNGFLVDLTPPEFDFVGDGFDPPDQERIIFPDAVLSHWKAHDSLSGIQRYTMSVGTYPGGNDIVEGVDAGQDLKWIVGNVDLKSGIRYYVTITATNGAGLSANMSSNGFTVGGSIIEFAPNEGARVYFDEVRLTESVQTDRSNDTTNIFPINREESIGAVELSPLDGAEGLKVESSRVYQFLSTTTPAGRKRRQVVGSDSTGVNPATTAPDVSLYKFSHV